jgi:ribosome maturation factor RimP
LPPARVAGLEQYVERLHRLEERVEPTLEAMGFAVVRIVITGSEGRRSLQVMAERHDGSAITVEDCAQISRTLSAIFDVEDPLPGRYDLEVSSTGIDRPLTRRKDFETYAGFEAKVDAKTPVGGRKRFRGRLKGLNAGGEVVIATEDGEAAIAFDNVNAAKLILTDELIAATTRQTAEH